MASNLNSNVCLQILDQYKRQELEDWLELDRRYPTVEEKLRAQVKANFPGIRYADEKPGSEEDVTP